MGMRNLVLWLSVFAVAAAASAADAPAAKAEAQIDPMMEALKTGATVAQTFTSYLKPHATTKFPGILAWMTGAGATLAGLDRERPTEAWRSLDPDQFITRNPAWWQAFYEISPADPGLALLQGGGLLCAGDPQRAMEVLRLSLNHADLDAAASKIIVTLMQYAGAYMEPSHAMVREGVALHDKGDFIGAIAKYDAALKVWPRNGWALYEKGFSVRLNERKDDFPPVTVAMFKRSREVDPFQWSAWQGVVKEIPGLKEMQAVVRPVWEQSKSDLNYRMSDEELATMADALQLAGVHDLALITRQMLVQHRGRYAPEDHPFIARSLRRLVPGDRTEATLAKLASPTFKAIRLYEPLAREQQDGGEK